MAWILPGLLKSLSSSSLSTSSGSIVVWLGLSLAIINVPVGSATAAVPEPSTSSPHFTNSNAAPELAVSLEQEKPESNLANRPLNAPTQAIAPNIAPILSTAPPLHISLQPSLSEEVSEPAPAVEPAALDPSVLETSAPLLSASLSIPGATLSARSAIAAAPNSAVSTPDAVSQPSLSAPAVSPPLPNSVLTENVMPGSAEGSAYSSVAAPLVATPLTGQAVTVLDSSRVMTPVTVAPGYNLSASFTFYPQTSPTYAVAQTLPYAQPSPLANAAISAQPAAQSSMSSGLVPSEPVPVFNSATGSYIMMVPAPGAVQPFAYNPPSTFSVQVPLQSMPPIGGTSGAIGMNSGYNPYALPGFSPGGSAVFNPAMVPNPYAPAPSPYGQIAFGQAPVVYGQTAYGQSQNPYVTAPYGQATYPQAYGQAPVVYGQAYGQNPYGQAPNGQAPYAPPSYAPPAAYAQNPYGQVPYGQAPYGQIPYGQVPYGQNPYGQNPYGQVPYGQNPYGQAPTGYQGVPPLAVPSVPRGDRAIPLPPPPPQGQAVQVFPVGYPVTYPTSPQGTPLLAPTPFQQSQQPIYGTPGTGSQAPTYLYPGNPIAAPAPMLGAPGQESLMRRAPVTAPSIQLQGAFIYQGDEFSSRARVAAIYPFSPNVLLGGILDFANGPAITSTDSEGVSINELYLAASLDELPGLRLVVGQIDLTSYFDRNSFAKDSLTHFLNPVFQTNPALAAAAIGSRSGILLNWSLSDNLEAKAAAFSSDRSITDFALDGFVGEVGFRTGNFILRGTYTTSIDGGQRSSFQEVFSVARQDGGFGVDEDDREDAYGVNAELFIPELNMGIFGRYGQYTNQDLDLKGDTYSLGVNFLDLFTPGDRLGVGYGRSLSNDSLRVQAGTELPDVLEVFYDLQLQRNLRMGFSFQQLNEFSESVAGIRVRADFDVSPRGAL